MKFCPVVPEIYRGHIHVAKKERRRIIIIIIYNYGLHEKLISIIIKLRKGYFPKVGPKDQGKVTLSRFNNY